MKLSLVQRLSLGFAALCICMSAAAQSFPTRPVKIVVPYLAGGGPDNLARLLGERLQAKWGQPVVVDNKPGAGGAVGAQALKAAPADGYTFMLSATGLVQLPHMVAPAPYDTLKDFAPVTHLGGTHLALLVNSQVPVNNVREFIAYAKERPGRLNFASYGAGSLSHIFGEVFNDAAKTDLTHVAYKGDSPALMDLMEGRVESAFLSVFLVKPQMATGKIKVLAVTGSTRSPLLPDVPTMEEAGVKGLDMQGWFGLFAPAGTPMAVQTKVAGDIRDILAQADVKAKLLGSGIVAGGNSPAEFTRQVRSDYEMYGRIIHAHKISLN
jgi:tripartite-type tricarboxylate transporter receptor subunit TctC